MKLASRLCLIVVFAALCIGFSHKDVARGDSPLEVRSGNGNLDVRLSSEGRIIDVILGKKRLVREVTAETVLADCRREGAVAVRMLDGGGVQFTKRLIDKSGKNQCVLTERFLPGRDGIRWEIEIQGEGEPWSAPIVTRLNYPSVPSRMFWTAWSDPEHRKDGWRDPLAFRPFSKTDWTYAYTHHGRPTEGNFITMPLAMVAELVEDAAMSIILSPDDPLLDLNLSTDQSGTIEFARTRYRIGGDKPLRFSLDLIAHPADWRGALGWLVARYPQYFNPSNPKADEMAGCGAYSGDENPIDAAKFKRMAFRVNWKLSDDFPYMGMFLPPLNGEDDRWDRSCAEPSPPNKPRWTSFRRLNDYAKYMREQGFYVLNYFNVTEFGKNMKDAPVAADRRTAADLWRNPVEYLKLQMPEAYFQPPIGTCYGAWVTDVGDPDYRRFMLEQAKRHIEMLPDTSGICIDRMDWLRYYNPRGDDGVSWVDGKPARSLYLSWKDFMAELGPMMHEAGKVIFVNNHVKRLDLLRHVDGIYCEFAQEGPALNATGLLCLRRPAIGWTANEGNLRPEPDAFFQRHLHMGVYPTAPYPGNHHCITPSPWADAQYLDYGPLLDAMRGKKWVLAPHCVETETPGVKVNLFEVPGGFVVPVTFAGKATSARVVLRGLSNVTERTVCEALHPGSDKPLSIAPKVAEDGAVCLDVPLERGCAMVRLRTGRP